MVASAIDKRQAEPEEGRPAHASVSEADTAGLMREGLDGGLPGALDAADQRRQLLALQRTAGNAAVNRLLREVAPPVVGAGTPSTILVADDATPGAGQMGKTAFLDALEPALCQIAEEQLGSRAQGLSLIHI